jgi:hypothetical protein
MYFGTLMIVDMGLGLYSSRLEFGSKGELNKLI